MGCNSNAGGSGIGGSTKGLEEGRDYEFDYDDEFKQAVGSKVNKILTGSKSTRNLISDLKEIGYKLEGEGRGGINDSVHRLDFSREKNNTIESLAIQTEEGYRGGEHYFYMNSAAYHFIKLNSN